MYRVLHVSLQDLASEDTGEGDENTLGDVVEEELAATSQAVEEAAQRIQAMLAKSREDDSGVKLEVNERILDSCTGLMKTIKTLILRARDLQGEIIAEGMVSIEDLHYREHRLHVHVYHISWSSP